MRAPDTYQDIFTARGDRYHAVMARWPDVRAGELCLLPRILKVSSGETLIDAPAGGGYVAPLLPEGVRYIAVEQVDAFYDHCPADGLCSRMMGAMTDIELPDGCADAVMSLAGLHHEPDVDKVIAEFARLLKPGGRLGIADAAIGSPPDRFLNGFVNEHSSAGHDGIFFDATLAQRLSDAGLVNTATEHEPLRWQFPDISVMVHFVRGLFGIDQATDKEILAGVEDILGTETPASGGIAMRWELLVVTGNKPQ